ncbi:MAG TPA: hypothetical protein VGD64_10230 [Acidisarcina sp.]
MTVGTLALLAFSGSVVNFALAIRMRKLAVSGGTAASQSNVAIGPNTRAEQKRKRIRLASWLAFAAGAWLLGAAVFFEVVGFRQ